MDAIINKNKGAAERAMHPREALKRLEPGFLMSVAGTVLVALSFFSSFDFWPAALFVIGFGLVFTVLELQVWKMIVLGENAMGNPQRKALLATILLTALGAGFMIAALINVLETVPFVLFFAGLGLILGSIQLTIRKAGAARD